MTYVRALCLRIALCAYVSLSVPTYRSLCLRIALCAYVSLSVPIHLDFLAIDATIRFCSRSHQDMYGLLYTGLDFTECDAGKIADAMCRLLERWPSLDGSVADDYQYAKQSRRHASRDLALS